MAAMQNAERQYGRGETTFMKSAGWTYIKEFGGAMLAYTIVLPISIALINAHPHAAWRAPVALAPIVPAALALWAFVRQMRRLDELQRRIQFEALAVSFGATGLLTLASTTRACRWPSRSRDCSANRSRTSSRPSLMTPHWTRRPPARRGYMRRRYGASRGHDSCFC
ncbi:MAG: hypothetical protein LC769_12930 [Chloroflexi bacterium]|nr:hypothetical protein [Chloroflexota bacterium]